MIALRVGVSASGRFVGNGYIAGSGSGIVSVAGAPASRRVALMDKATGQIVGRVGSAPDGTYRFSRVNPMRRYAVIGFDYQLQFNAVIRDNITPAVDE